MQLDYRILYHQIHPAKLAADWLTTPIALPVGLLVVLFGWTRGLLVDD